MHALVDRRLTSGGSIGALVRGPSGEAPIQLLRQASEPVLPALHRLLLALFSNLWQLNGRHCCNLDLGICAAGRVQLQLGILQDRVALRVFEDGSGDRDFLVCDETWRFAGLLRHAFDLRADTASGRAWAWRHHQQRSLLAGSLLARRDEPTIHHEWRHGALAKRCSFGFRQHLCDCAGMA